MGEAKVMSDGLMTKVPTMAREKGARFVSVELAVPDTDKASKGSIDSNLDDRGGIYMSEGSILEHPATVAEHIATVEDKPAVQNQRNGTSNMGTERAASTNLPATAGHIFIDRDVQSPP